MFTKSERINVLTTYAEELTDYWNGIFKNRDLSLKINIIPYINNLSAVEVIFINDGHMHKDRTYKVKEEFAIDPKVYDMNDTSNEFIYFGDNSFLILKPMFMCYWTDRCAELDNAYLFNQILLGSEKEG